MSPPPRRMMVLGLLTTLMLALLLTAHLTRATGSALAVKVGGKVSELLHAGLPDSATQGDEVKKSKESVVSGEIGKHFHVRPSASTPKTAAVAGCEYPVVIHVTPDGHCTGVLALYGSIVRNVLMQPEALKGKTCVHVTYMDPALTSIEEMYKWTARPNPFSTPEDCAKLDKMPALNDVVPIRFQALRGIEKPDFMQALLAEWLVALNKVHSWAFDAYPRILLMDADSIQITNLHLIFDESNPRDTVTGAPDQFNDCGDRSRINGGMILLRPSRYFHINALEMIYDQDSSCTSQRWEQSEQELLNCLCGTQGPPNGLRPEFSCAIMPFYNSVWPRNYACSAVNVEPMRSIHFTAATKPWKVDLQKLSERFDYGFWRCVLNGTRGGSGEALKACEMAGMEESRKLDTLNTPEPMGGE
ncbi:uncharacterized protein RSE6_13799 [Rhynchosporium secalis]|uniref:Nucleotide-diphospho-sugar transferase domain-containing protein n=1 Tax=Rhynchosporium secalis TaxID=38038 RepID=A0A1E1MTP9_RHYSE|nr:uncharacterized protein RSE6_13799 [Rhynchosporium secalis]